MKIITFNCCLRLRKKSKEKRRFFVGRAVTINQFPSEIAERRLSQAESLEFLPGSFAVFLRWGSMDFVGIARCETIKPPPANPIAHENCLQQPFPTQRFQPVCSCLQARIIWSRLWLLCVSHICRATICVDVLRRSRVLVQREDKTRRSSWCELKPMRRRRENGAEKDHRCRLLSFCTGFYE